MEHMRTCVRWGNDEDDELAGIATLLQSPIQGNTATPVDSNVSVPASPAASAPLLSPPRDDPWEPDPICEHSVEPQDDCNHIDEPLRPEEPDEEVGGICRSG
jgi:hypothetical protein